MLASGLPGPGTPTTQARIVLTQGARSTYRGHDPAKLRVPLCLEDQSNREAIPKLAGME